MEVHEEEEQKKFPLIKVKAPLPKQRKRKLLWRRESERDQVLLHNRYLVGTIVTTIQFKCVTHNQATTPKVL